MEYAYSNIIKGVKALLKTAGYQNSKIRIIRQKGRNNIVLKDLVNNLFIKIYSEKSVLLNSIEAQKIIEKEIRVPSLFFYSKSKIKGGGYVGVWKLITGVKIREFNNISDLEIQGISETILKIHGMGNLELTYGSHFPKKDRTQDWNSYLKRWVKKSIRASTREVSGYQKKQIISLIDYYLNSNQKQLRGIETSLLHGDIDISNFLFTKKGQLYVTDLDYSIYGDPAWEFASAVAEWKFSAPCYRGILNKYLEGKECRRKQKEEFINRVEYYGPLKKAVLIYAIKDVSSLAEVEEMNLCLRELGRMRDIW